MSEPTVPVSGVVPFPVNKAHSEPTNAELFEALELMDRKVNALGEGMQWCVGTLKWMSDVFRGIQSMASMMPGKAGKAARTMLDDMNGKGN
jgi:hypothetical protein